MKNKKFLILGAQGQLGKKFIDVLSSKGAIYDAPNKTDCDITDVAKMQKIIDKVRPDIIINCAAYNAVDEAEDNPDRAYSVNSKAVENLARLSKENDIFLVHYSSDYVFDGKKQDLYTEEDRPIPINIYGKTKLQGEEFIKETLSDYLIYRLSWVIGEGRRNFLYKLSNWAKEKDILKISSDEVSVPTYTEDIVNITLMSLEKGLKGLYHLTNTGCVSRYELAKYFINKMGLDKEIVPAKMKDFKTKAKRPSFSCMSNKKISNDLAINIPHWQDAVDRYILAHS